MIYYLDDDEDDLEIFLDTVEQLGATATTSREAAQMLSLLQKAPLDGAILFLDINMPARNGFEVLEEIKGAERLKGLPVIMFSTANTPEAVERSRALGADIFAVKPLTLPEWRRVIGEIIALDWDRHRAEKTRFVFKA